MKTVLLPLLLLAVCPLVLAQQAPLPLRPEVTLHFGIVYAGSGRSIEKQMTDDGFGGETFGGFFFSSEENPLREEGSVQVGIKFPVKNKYTVKGLLCYRETDVTGNAVFFEPLAVNTAVFTTAAIGYAPIKSKIFRVGAGPAFHLAKGKVALGDAEQTKKNFSKPGFVLESGFSFPANKRVYADLQVQYFYVGKGDLGQHTFTSSDFEDKPVSARANFTNTSFSSFIISLGAGYRFNKG